MRGLAAAVAVIAAYGCNYGGGAFECTTDAECTRGANAGTCQPTGFCSFADPTCGSGQRYGDLSGELSGVCVGDEPTDAAIDGPATDDGGFDAPQFAARCPADPTLRLCFSFDQDPLPSPLPNEGAVAVDAQVAGVTRIVDGAGGAALLDTSSTLFVPMASAVTAVVAIEIWFRVDVAPADGQRSGLADSNTSPNISLFLNRVGATHELRCGIGAQTTVWTVDVAVGAWVYAACVCDAGNHVLYVDGAMVGAPVVGACSGGGTIVADGFAIGADNTGTPGVVDEWLVGAISGVRLWDVALPASTIQATAALPR